MRVLKIDNGDRKICNYPRMDMGVIPNLDENIKFYYIHEDTRPSFNSNTHYLKVNESFVDANPIGDYYKTYEVIQLSNEAIIDNLNTSIGNYLDETYPLWERAKHAGEGAYILQSQIDGTTTTEQWNRKAYIDTIFYWVSTQRAKRDQMENELLTNGILPSFKWDARPTL